MPLPVIIDCDPGVDDAVMLLLACASPELDIRMVTTVAGNVGPEKTWRNARGVLRLAGRDEVPVHAGCERPLRRAPIVAEMIHGESGLGPVRFDGDDGAGGGDAVGAMTRMVMAEPERSLTLVATGPLTNVATAIQAEPRFAARLRRIVWMGGARAAGGNITPSAEFNAFADPHAAAIVMDADIEVVAFGLDATHQVRADERHIAAIEAVGTPRAATAARLLRFSDGVMRGLDPALGAPLHDPCTIAWAVRPELFELRPCRIAVETEGQIAFGHTAVDFRNPGRHLWATKADADGVFALLAERLA